MERETKEHKVGSHTLVVNSYITGREARDIEGAIMNKLELSQSIGKGTEIKGLYGIQIRERQDLQVKAVVVSIDSNSEKVLDSILDLPSSESEEIMNIVRDVAEPKKDEEKKKV